jgi:hypothetical protein
MKIIIKEPIRITTDRGLQPAVCARFAPACDNHTIQTHAGPIAS